MPEALEELPKFKSEVEEREFWRTHDSARYLDLSRTRPAVFSNLQPTSRTISIRLPETLLAEIESLAAKRGVPYQSFMKMMIARTVEEELEKLR